MSVEDLIEEIEIEFEYIETVLDELETLDKKPPDVEPSIVEVTAAGAFLHNYYNGIENIFKRILKFNKLRQEENKDWHKELLQKFHNRENTFAFLDDPVYEDLLEILKFRHFFVHGYGFFLQWNMLKPLIKKAIRSHPKFKTLCNGYTLSLQNTS